MHGGKAAHLLSFVNYPECTASDVVAPLAESDLSEQDAVTLEDTRAKVPAYATNR